MIEPSRGVPAHIALLLNEDFSAPDIPKLRRKLRGMLPDLRAQIHAEGPAATMPDLNADPTRFRVVLSAGLDLFARQGACQAPPCRAQYADQVARTIALMADEVTVHDYFADQVLELTRPTNLELNLLLTDIFLLHRLRPLIAAGVLRFRSTVLPACSSCISEFDRRVSALSGRLLNEFGETMSVKRYDDGSFAVDSGALYQPSMFRYGNGHAISDSEIRNQVMSECVRTALWDARNAAFVNGAVFSNSKAGLTGLLAEEGRFTNKQDLLAFEGHRAAQLPWVAGLTIEQTLQLREEAQHALPALRVLLAQKLAAQANTDLINGPTDSFVHELRQQAAHVESELRIATSRRRSLARNTLGILSLGITAYGMASDAMTPLGGTLQLLATLGLLHELGTPNTEHQEQLKARPGYVLVAAKDILAHAPTKST